MNPIPATPLFAQFDPTLPVKWYNAGEGFGFELSNERPVYYGPFGLGEKIVFTYTPIYAHPMFYRQSNGVCIAAGQFDPTDQGSVPIPVQWLIPKDSSHEFYGHDFSYKTGGRFFWYPGEKGWTFRQITRPQADMLLRIASQYDPRIPLTPRRAKLVWEGVCAFRPFSSHLYHVWQPGDGIPQWPTDDPPDVDDGLPMGAGAQ